ncbi:hypothetical protein [Winogradskyella sp.]|uniref:hypothetical protein n=1 Tax=Winogradskyella sp. TaxID=1883156 RepID=UPI0025EDF324|nr:hypothetical protein [Winogradskyella sp.]
MKKICIAFFLFVFGLNFSFAQYDWTKAKVYLKNSEVLNGEAKILMMGSGMNLSKEILKYRIGKKEKISKYKPEEIDSIVFIIEYKKKVDKKEINETCSKIFVPVFLNKKKSRLGFVEILVDGELKLVARTVIINYGGNSSNITIGVSSNNNQDDYMGGHNQVLLLKNDEKPEVFYRDTSAKFFRKRAGKYFKDCISLRDKIENKSFKKEDVQDIAKYYNFNCAK